MFNTITAKVSQEKIWTDLREVHLHYLLLTEKRINFKKGLIFYKALHFNQPHYLLLKLISNNKQIIRPSFCHHIDDTYKDSSWQARLMIVENKFDCNKVNSM